MDTMVVNLHDSSTIMFSLDELLGQMALLTGDHYYDLTVCSVETIRICGLSIALPFSTVRELAMSQESEVIRFPRLTPSFSSAASLRTARWQQCPLPTCSVVSKALHDVEVVSHHAYVIPLLVSLHSFNHRTGILPTYAITLLTRS